MNQALVFPGQGSQRPGMATPWRDVPGFERWEEAGDVLGWDVARLGTDANAEELRAPAACQVALFVHHAVLLEAWRSQGGEVPVATAGHSLGEYDALLAAGALGFEDALRLVAARARHTQEAAQGAPGTMVACLGFGPGVVESACATAGATVANDNAPGQLVVAGGQAMLDALRAELAAERGRVVDLDVGAAYHSPHMAAAVDPLGEALDTADFRDADVRVVANVDAQPHAAAGEWRTLLRRQVVEPVRWRESVLTLRKLGVEEVVELAAAPVLVNLVKRIDGALGRRSVTQPADLGLA